MTPATTAKVLPMDTPTARGTFPLFCAGAPDDVAAGAASEVDALTTGSEVESVVAGAAAPSSEEDGGLVRVAVEAVEVTDRIIPEDVVTVMVGLAVATLLLLLVFFAAAAAAAAAADADVLELHHDSKPGLTGSSIEVIALGSGALGMGGTALLFALMPTPLAASAATTLLSASRQVTRKGWRGGQGRKERRLTELSTLVNIALGVDQSGRARAEGVVEASRGETPGADVVE